MKKFILNPTITTLIVYLDFILVFLFIAFMNTYTLVQKTGVLFNNPFLNNYINKITSINLIEYNFSFWLAEIIILTFVVLSILFKRVLLKNIFFYYELTFMISTLILTWSTYFYTYNKDFFAFWQFILSFFFWGYVYILTNKLDQDENKTSIEFFSLIFGSLLAVFLLIKASNLFLLWFILEFLSLLSYALSYCSANYQNKASFYYFIFNSIAGAIMLISIVIVLKILPSNTEVDYTIMVHYLSLPENSLVSSFFMFLFMIGFFIKLGVFPFHFWNIDVYSNVSSRVLFFFIIINKLALFLVLYKLVFCFFSSSFNYLYYFFCVLSIISSIVASFQLVKTYDLNKFIALTSLVQSGYVTAGICTNVNFIGKISLFYLLFYIFLMLLLFGNLSTLNYKDRSIVNVQTIKNIPEFKYLFILIIFSLIGVPPFMLFFLKFQLFQFFGFNNLVSLLISFLIISVFTCFYYLKFLNSSLLKSNIYTKTTGEKERDINKDYETNVIWSIDMYFILNLENIIVKYLHNSFILNFFSYVIIFIMGFILPFFYFNILNDYSFFYLPEKTIIEYDSNVLLENTN